MGGDGAGLYYLPMGIKDFTEPAFELSESLIYGWDGAGLYYLPMGIKDFGEPAPTVLGDNEITLPLQGCKK
jgi:hypothetical protein